MIFGSNGEKSLQRKFGTVENALKFYNDQMLDYLAPLMQDFIAQQEMTFISTSDAHGKCDSSVRFGEKGFIKVLDKKHLIYAELKGNGVMASMGNISENPHIGLLFIDFFETKVGLHINGKVKLLSESMAIEKLSLFDSALNNILMKGKQVPAQYLFIEVEEAYIHCSIHIPLLKKVEKNDYPQKFKMFDKGGDAFEIKGLA